MLLTVIAISLFIISALSLGLFYSIMRNYQLSSQVAQQTPVNEDYEVFDVLLLEDD